MSECICNEGFGFNLSCPMHAPHQQQQGHTPGPWKVDDNNELPLAVIQDNADGLGIAEITGNMADARLIAAAPEMLEALKMVDREIAGASFEHIGNARGIIAAAIARATNG